MTDAREVVFEFIDAHRAQYAASTAVRMDVDDLTQNGGKGQNGKGNRKHGQDSSKIRAKRSLPENAGSVGKQVTNQASAGDEQQRLRNKNTCT
eukprot:5160113-Amphidinium_carterae.1